MENAFLFVTGISDGSCLACVAAAECDVGLVGYEMAVLVEKAGAVLTPELRAELQSSPAAMTPNEYRTTEHRRDDGPAFRVRSYVIHAGSHTLERRPAPRDAGQGHAPGSRRQRPGWRSSARRSSSLCNAPISIAEISAHLSIPLGVARVLVGDMAEEGFLTSYKPQHAKTGERPDLKLLERVLDGLQAL